MFFFVSLCFALDLFHFFILFTFHALLAFGGFNGHNTFYGMQIYSLKGNGISEITSFGEMKIESNKNESNKNDKDEEDSNEHSIIIFIMLHFKYIPFYSFIIHLIQR